LVHKRKLYISAAQGYNIKLFHKAQGLLILQHKAATE